jgi:hypothetical protein
VAQERVCFPTVPLASNPSVQSVVKTFFENGTEIELAQAATEWDTTVEGGEKSTQDAMTLKVGTVDARR